MANPVAEVARTETERLRAEWMQLIEAAEQYFGGQIEKLEEIEVLAAQLPDGTTKPELMKALGEATEVEGNGRPALPAPEEEADERGPEAAEDDAVQGKPKAEAKTPAPVAGPSGRAKKSRSYAQETYERAKAWIEGRGGDSFPKRQIFDALDLTEGEWNTLRRRLVEDGIVTVTGQRSAQRFHPARQGGKVPQTKSERPTVVPESAPQAPTPEGIVIGTLERIPSGTLEDLYELCEAELNEAEVKKGLGEAVRHGEAKAKRNNGKIVYSSVRVTA